MPNANLWAVATPEQRNEIVRIADLLHAFMAVQRVPSDAAGGVLHGFEHMLGLGLANGNDRWDDTQDFCLALAARVGERTVGKERSVRAMAAAMKEENPNG